MLYNLLALLLKKSGQRGRIKINFHLRVCQVPSHVQGGEVPLTPVAMARDTTEKLFPLGTWGCCWQQLLHLTNNVSWGPRDGLFSVSIRQNFVTGDQLVLQLSLLSLSAFIWEAHGKALSQLPLKAGVFSTVPSL